MFQIQARNTNGFTLQVLLMSLKISGVPERDTINLGFVHDGTVEFLLVETNGRFTTALPVAWLQSNLKTLGHRKLRNLCIPGSHDAGMSSLNGKTLFATECNVITQTKDIAGQLACGVRYFDIRPTIHGGLYFTGHYSDISQIGTWQGANGQSISSIIKDINSFTKASKELIILYLSHDLNTDVGDSSYRPFLQSEWNALLGQLGAINHLYKTTALDLTEITLNDYIGGGKAAVIIIVDASGADINLGLLSGQGYYLPSYFNVYNEYSDTNDLDSMVADQLEKLTAQRTNPDAGYFLLSWTLTQSNDDVLNCELSEVPSIRDLANMANSAIYNSLLSHCDQNTYPNILYIDNVETTDIAALAMDINQLT